MMLRTTRTVGVAAVLAVASAGQSGGPVDSYRSSFEGTDGGWTADATWDPRGDWERGVPTAGPFPGCSFGNGPGAAFDGAECWATQLDACTTSVVGSNFLRQTFDFTAVVDGTLSWREFLHIIGSQGNNRARVRINGDILYESPFTNVETPGYVFQSVDLSAYNNLPSVEIVFELQTVSLIARPGWYIDDVRITSLVQPNPGDLGVILEDSPDPVTAVGDPVVYRVTAVNHSDAAASGVVVTGTLDPGLSFNAALSDPAVEHDGSPTGGGFTISVGAMAPFSARGFDVTADTTRLGEVSATATLTGTEADPNPANDAAQASTTVALIADLVANLGSTQNPVIGDTPFTYLLEIRNDGPSDATNVSWTLNLPVQSAFIAASEGNHDGTALGGIVRGTIPLLGAGAFRLMTVNARPLTGDLEQLAAGMQAALTSPDETDPVPVNNTSQKTVGHVESTAPFAAPLFTSSGLDFVAEAPLPTSVPPGLPDRTLSFLARPYVSDDGRIWGFHSTLDSTSAANNEVIVVVDPSGARTAVYEDVTPLPDVAGEFVSNMFQKLSVNDSGCLVFTADSTGSRQDLILKGCPGAVAGGDSLTVIARQGQPIPGDALGRNYSFGSKEPQMDNAGVIRFFARALQADSNTEEMLVQTANDGLTLTTLLTEGMTFPGGQAGGATNPWDEFDREFSTARSGLYVTGDGSRRLLRGDTTAPTTGDDVLTIDNVVVVQEAQFLPGSSSPVAEPGRGVYLAPNGDWYARGRNADGTQWVLRNGAVLARTGDEIFPGAGEHWTAPTPNDGFTVVAGDAHGNYLVAGTTDAPPADTVPPDSFLPPIIAVLNGQHVVMRTGDPVDVDKNGLFDHETTLTRIDDDGAIFLADGSIVARVSVSAVFDFGAVASGSTSSAAPAIVVISNTRGACCLPGAGGSCVDDFPRLDCDIAGGRHFAGQVCASVSCRRGACCPAIGQCIDGVEPGFCQPPNFVYQGDGTECAETICPEATGACCYSDGGCLDPIAQSDCVVGGNIWHHDKACSEVTCQRRCTTTADCDDNDLCNGADACVDGVCVTGPPPEIDDGVACTIDACDPATGEVTHIPLDATCNDFDPCNGVETCDPVGGCLTGAPPDCDDGVNCTSDFCSAGHPGADPKTGCVNVANHAACEDGIDCTDDVCNVLSGCARTVNHLFCLNADPCDGAESCDPILGCLPGEAPSCDDGIPCTDDFCDASHPEAHPQTGCVNAPNHASCEDGVACTIDLCEPGSGGCTRTLDHLFCLDENQCTENERCDAELDCVTDPKDCNDNVPCTIDTCDPVIGCLNGADNTQCNDGVDCTIDACRPNRPERDVNGCVYDPEDFLCSSTDLCVPARCDPATGCRFEPRECPDDGDPCTREFCDSGTGDCLQETICGACCRVGQPCLDGLTVTQCSGAFDTFMGLGTTCATAPCGACCDVDTGACFDGIAEAECTAAGRRHRGPGTTCAQDRCLGACCDPSFTAGGCTESITAAECAAIDTDAIFVGVDTSCANAPCGACCDPLDSDSGTSCLESATSEFCAALGYAYMGDRTTCELDTCQGACCLPDGSCVVAAPEECPGDFRGNGTACDELNPACAPFVGGACCRPNDTCVDGTTPEGCASHHKGRHQGPDTRCDDILCETTGACCLPDGTCAQSTEIGCADGAFQGGRTSCADACKGACCLFTGECIVTNDTNCAADYRGDGTNCAELNPPCDPNVVGACCTIDGCRDDVARADCLDDPRNDFRGEGVRCDQVRCLGACCTTEGTPGCNFVTRAICANFGEVYLGDGILCLEHTCKDCTTDPECVNGDRCDGDEFCLNGRCAGTPPPTVDDGVDCTVDICDPVDGVSFEPRDENCDEGNPCRDYFCDPVTGCFHISTCDDGDPCTDDICTDAGQCLSVPVVCEDNDSLFCNGAQLCVDGVCVPSGPPLCNPVTEVCDEDRDACVPRCDVDADCDDGRFCNGLEVCSQFSGGCAPGIAPCRSADQICDEGGDLCVNLCAPAAATAPVGDCTFRGDTDGDGSVDLRDGRALLNFFGQGAPPGDPAEILDLNRDGRIGSEDVALFALSMTTPR